MINCNRRDGSARAVNEVAERLARRGHDVHLFARKAEDLDLGLIRWHRVGGPTWPEVADFGSYHLLVNQWLKRNDFDIVHSIGCNTLAANVVTIQNIQPAKMKILKWQAEREKVSPPRRFTRWLYLRTTSRAESRLYTAQPGRPSPLFLPVSRGVAAELTEYYSIGDAPVRIIPNAADTAIFHPISPAERRCWREANGLRPDDLVCIFSGGEWGRKGLDYAIEAIARIRRPEVKLFVAGDDPDRARFHAQAAALDVADRVVFGGFRGDVATALAASDLFLFPSHYEAFSLASIEAAACGLPIVAPRINGTEDFIQPGETGVFVEHDAAQIASALEPLLADSTLRRAMGENARALVEKHYTWDRIAAMTEDAYLEHLERLRAQRENA